MHHPSSARLVGVVLAALLPPAADALVSRAAVPGDPRGEPSIWYAFAAEQFSRTDGATALYESTRRQAGRPPRGTSGS